MGFLPLLFLFGCELRAADLLLIGEQGAVPHTRFADALTDQVEADGRLSLAVHWLDQDSIAGKTLSSRIDEHAPRLLITVGQRAAQLLADSATQPLLHTMLTPDQFQSLYPNGAPGGVGAIYYTQPLSRQLDLLRLLQPGHEQLLIILGQSSNQLAGPLEQGCVERGLEAKTVTLSPDASLAELLEQHLPHQRLLFTPADPEVVNRRTIQVLLLTAFKAGVPVVGYSAAMVKAGALMAVHTTPEQLGTESAEISIHHLFHNDSLPTRHPKRFSVSVNYQVARALGLKLGFEASLTDRLHDLEAEHE